MGDKILVTGGHGFLGKKIVDLLKHFGYHVYAPPVTEVDLLKKQQLCNAFSAYRPDFVINAAAMVGGISENKSRPAEFFYQNLVMGTNVIEEAMRHEVKKFVQVGSACAYPANASMPLHEKDIWNGYPEVSNAPYGIAKRALLEMLQAYRAQYNLNGIYVVPTNLYGPGDRSRHVIPDTIKKVRQANEWGYASVGCWGTGNVTRDFLYVDDAAAGIVHMLQHYNSSEPINLGTGVEHKLKGVIELIAKMMDYSGKVVFDGRKELDGQERRVLSVGKAIAYNWHSRIGLITGLVKTIKWFTGTECASQQ